MSKNIELPSLLAFERKLETSDALMFAGNWQNIENASYFVSSHVSKHQNY